ncbi:MAG: LPS export ABC transporter periplasmic protein LptC [Treponemataceae bacterium]|nr:LPS export ABC transporter periplasmic protein LptC [Treponemataceae bacterium]
MDKRLNSFFFSILFLIFFSFFGCSLEYESDTPEQIRAPEFTFEELELTKVEKGRKKAIINANTLEQYHKLNASFAKDVRFKLFNDTNLIEVEGEAELLSVDNKSETYTMFNSVSITSYEQSMNIQAKNLKWNNKTEQLTSSQEDIVTISNLATEQKKGYVKPKSENTSQITLEGKGFSASGVTWQYAFKNATTGKIIIEDKEKGTTDETSEE